MYKNQKIKQISFKTVIFIILISTLATIHLSCAKEPIMYTVTLNYNYEGYENDYFLDVPIWEATVEEGKPYSPPTEDIYRYSSEFYEYSWVFKGWYIDSECAVSWTRKNVVMNDITLFAKWEWEMITTTPPPESEAPAQTREQVYVPDLLNVDEKTAVNIIIANGLIPMTEYNYTFNNVKSGRVVYTYPEVGEYVSKGDKITIYISKGAYSETASDSFISVANTHGIIKKEGVFFVLPERTGDDIHIGLMIAVDKEFSWVTSYNDGKSYCIIAYDADYKNSTLVTVYHGDKTNLKDGDIATCSIMFPAETLGNIHPNEIYVKLYIMLNGVKTEFEVKFYITWDNS